MADLSSRLRELFLSLGTDQDGRTERLFTILEKFYERMGKDTMLGFFFAGHDLKLIARKQASFLLRAMGVRQSYSGKSPSSAHLELPPILQGHFDRRIVILMEVLKQSGLPTEQISTWVAFERSFEKVIVSK